MGFFKKQKHNLIEDDINQVNDTPVVTDDEVDDFDIIESSDAPITRKKFREMAEENLQEAIDEGIAQVVVSQLPTEEAVESEPENADTYEEAEETSVSETEVEQGTDTTESIDEEPTAEVNDESDETMVEEPAVSDDTDNEIDQPSDNGDDFDDFTQSVSDDDDNNEEDADSEPEQKKEKKPRMTFSQFIEKYRNAVKVAIIVLCVFVTAFLALFVYGCATIPENVMGRNIYIEDIDVSGLTYEEALEKVRTSSLLDNCDITVTCKGMSYTINGMDIGLTPRIEDTVTKAMNHGKTGNILIDGFVNGMQVIARHTVMPSANVNETVLRDKLNEFGNIVYGELKEHQLEIGDEKLICTPGHSGFSGDTDEAYDQVIKALEEENFTKIRVSLKVSKPRTLSVEDIDAFVYTLPQDARFDITSNSVTVVPEVWGRHLDIDAIRPLVSKIHEGGEVVYIPFKTSEPAVKAADLESKLFNATLGSFSTYYGGSTSNRAANVANAASKINEKVLAPGEVFSFNDTVGKRSIANGFYTAPEYANGQTVMGIGGGTCQVSSTLYNAVLYADLSIVYRLNHMFTVNYCPIGQDATVSDSGVDFKFSNNTDYPIKISAVTSGGKITVSILGTQRDVPHTVKIENFSSYSGGNRSVRSYRSVFDPDGNLIRKEELPKSYYMSHETATEQNTQSQPAPVQPPAQPAPVQPPAQTPAQPAPVQPPAPEQPPAPVQPPAPEQVQTQ